jgi:hypothetical protein
MLAMVDFLVDSPVARHTPERIEGMEAHVPAHFGAEVLSAIGPLCRARELTREEVEARVELTAEARSDDISLPRSSKVPGGFITTSDWWTPSTSSWLANWMQRSSQPTLG